MINIDDKTRRLSQATIVIGYKQENKAESIEFKIPDYLKEYGKKICFKTKDGKVFSKLFDNTTSNIFTFTRTETQYGELNATIEFFKTENEDMIIYKTSMLHIIFNESIICEDEVQPDEPKIPILESLIEKVTDLNNTITENEEVRNNNEDTRISNENSRIANETQRDIYYTGIQNKVNNGEFNGATFTPSVDKDGNISWTNNKGLENPSSQNIRGPQGIQGAQGEPFKIKKTYSSIEEMQADFDNMEVGDYAMIVTSIELEDNAKLYSRTETEWVFITDFSGAQGIQGEQGPQGIQGIQGEKGTGISSLEVRDGSLYVTLTDNTQQNAGLIITDEVKQWIVNQVTDNAKSDFNTYYNGKIADFDEHTEQKTNEFDENAESLKAKVEELEKENKLIKEQIPGANASGNSIHVKDSGTLDFDWKINGGHKQATREGYNLFQIHFVSKTVGGVTVVTNEDKSIVANGTMTAAWLNFIQYDITDKLEDSETYTIWQKNYATGLGGIYLQIRQTEIENPTKFVDYYSASKKVTFTVDKSKYKYTANLQTAGKTETFNNYTNAYMLYKGTEDKPYEQYGVSPSPDYQSEVETVGNIVNEFNCRDTYTSKGITLTKYIDGSFKVEGTATENFNFNIANYFKLKGTHAFKYEVLEGNSPEVWFWNSTDSNSDITFSKTNNSRVVTFEDEKELKLNFEAVKGTTYSFTARMKIVKGKETGLYSPYGMGSVEIDVVNKNFYKASEKWFNNIGGVGLTVSERSNKECTLTTTQRAYTWFGSKQPGGSQEYRTKVKENTKYTFSIKAELLKGTAGIGLFIFFDRNLTGEYFEAKNKDYSSNITFVTPAGTNYIHFRIDIYNANTAYRISEIKIEAEDGTDKYEKHQSQTAIMPVQQEMLTGDYIADVEHHEWGKIESYNNEEINTEYISTTGELSQGATVYYKLETPVDLELTPEQQLVRDTKLYTYKNITNIDVSDELASIDVDYKKDLETEHNKLQNEIDEIKQLISTTETSALLLDNLQKDVESEVE